MTEATNTTETEATETTKKEPTPVVLARGRMPAPVVALIKFGEEGNDSEIARKYYTTAGKVSDIRKGRNFGYITEELKFTKAEIDEAVTKVKENFSSEKSDTSEADSAYTVEKLQGMEVVEESILEEVRAANRKPRGKKKEAEAAETVGETAEEQTEAVTEAEESQAEDDLADLLD